MSFGETGGHITENAFPTKSPDQRFERVVEYAPNAMILISADGTMEMVNAQTEIIFGYARDELLGQPIEMLVPERFRTGHPRLRRSYSEKPNPRPMGAGRDLYALRKDGSEFPVEIGLNPISDGEKHQILAAISDIGRGLGLDDEIVKFVRHAGSLVAGSEAHNPRLSGEVCRGDGDGRARGRAQPNPAAMACRFAASEEAT